MIPETFTGNGHGDIATREEKMPPCTILLYHSDSRKESELRRVLIDVVGRVPVVLCMELEELTDCCRGSGNMVAVVELHDQTLPFLRQPPATARVIVWAEAETLDLTLFAELLLGGVRSVVRQDEEKLQQAISQQFREIADQSAQESALLDLGERQGLVGRSPAWLKVLQQIAAVSQRSDVPVLLYGKSGTGKELVAHAIHRENKQFGLGPFKAVNCATMRGDIVRSELFGSKKGSYTGSVGDRTGLFEAAQGGTIFLDDIQALDPITQAMLLRALQEKRVLPVGASEEVQIKNVRVIAATNELLDSLIDTGHFRQDLYFRLNVLQIHLPLLRERGKDITLLAQNFLLKYAQAYSSRVECFAPEVLAAFHSLSWTGNVRELENVVISSIINGRGDQMLSLEDLNQRVLLMIAGRTAEADEPKGETLRAGAKSMVLDALRQAGGNRTWAAEILGISVRTLQRKLKAWRS